MKHLSRGFTIVELLVVIVVMGILVTVGVFAFGNWRERIATNEVKSDLKGVVTGMESTRNFSNGYPDAGLPSSFDQPSPGVDIEWISGDENSYCVEGKSKTRPSIIYHVTNTTKEPQAGPCLASTTPNMPVVTNSNYEGFYYHMFMQQVYGTIKPPTGPAVSSYIFYYRNNTSASSPWTVVTPTTSTSYFSFDQYNPLTVSYRNNTTTGSMRIIAVGTDGSQSPPLDITYQSFQVDG